QLLYLYQQSGSDQTSYPRIALWRDLYKPGKLRSHPGFPCRGQKIRHRWRRWQARTLRIHGHPGGVQLNRLASRHDGFIKEPSVNAIPAEILFDKVGDHIALVTLNRVDKRNAVNGALARALG